MARPTGVIGPASMRVIRPAAHRRMPWKNGGGATVEIAVAPRDADQDGFAWRISMAEIVRPGPFSGFPGIDRTLAQLAGGPLRLCVGARKPVLLTPGGPAFAFDGGEAASASLPGGPALVLNVMTRRGLARHHLERLAVGGPMSLDPVGSETLLFCEQGKVTVAGAASAMDLAASDTLVAPSEAGRLAVAVLQSAVLWRIDVFPDGVGRA